MLTAGATARDAQIAADIYRHTIPVLEAAEDELGGYVALRRSACSTSSTGSSSRRSCARRARRRRSTGWSRW